jgi:manganese/iron transport system substrate-binding protein
MNRRAAAGWALATALTTALVVAFMFAGCGQPGGSSTGRLAVVTTSSVFADMISNVGGDRITVTALVPHHADVHTFQPSPADVRAVAGARLLVMNGLGLDDWLRETIVNASSAGTPLVELGPGLSGVDLLPGEEPGTQNPHLWMAVPYAKGYVGEIEAALVSADPANAEAYHEGAKAYQTLLDALDQQIRSKIAAIPAADRRLVTFHDAFPYFAREYGLEIVGVAVEAPGQDPSAAEIAALIEAIKAAHVKAIFSEEQFPTQVVDQLAASTGAKVVAQLYDDSLGDPPITSYEALMDWDVDQLVSALA